MQVEMARHLRDENQTLRTAPEAAQMRFFLFNTTTTTTCTMQRPEIVVSNAIVSMLFPFYYPGAKWAFLERKNVGICSSRRDRSEEPSRGGTYGSTGYN